MSDRDLVALARDVLATFDHKSIGQLRCLHVRLVAVGGVLPNLTTALIREVSTIAHAAEIRLAGAGEQIDREAREVCQEIHQVAAALRRSADAHLVD